MLFQQANLVKGLSTTTGPGNLTVTAATGFQSFTAFADGAPVYYMAEKGDEREIGLGTWNAPDQLVRDTVFFSTNGNAKVNFQGEGGIDIRAVTPAQAMTGVYLGRHGAGGQQTFDMDGVITPMFDNYEMWVNAFSVSLDAGIPRLKVKVAGLVQSGASDYEFALSAIDSTGASNPTASAASFIINLSTAGGIAAGEADAWTGRLELINANSTTRKTRLRISGEYREPVSGDFASIRGTGAHTVAANAVDGLQFISSTGVISLLDIDVYGRVGGGLL
ncbi:MAG: hypothetical protein MI806_07350 [Minwuiales bacterium]|nr:hypothetical protein [Minwuiales bacterium]